MQYNTIQYNTQDTPMQKKPNTIVSYTIKTTTQLNK